VNVLVLQHVDCEPAAAYADALESSGIGISAVAADRVQWPLDWRAFDGIVVMGGPMGAGDAGELAWLARELELIREAVRGGTPFLGVCLGAQLLAAALGATVRVAPEPEVGVLPVFRAAHDPVFAALPPTVSVLQWHSDTFDLPEGATLLWSSDACRNQAFRFGSRAYGVQFHLETPVALVRKWAEIPGYRAALERAGGPDALPRLIADLERNEADLLRAAHLVMAAWIEHCLLPGAGQQAGRSLAR
jgi:GMP synthase (glutamine-hydrolysing)